MTVITSSTGNASSPDENLKQAVDKDQDENDSEFLVWLEKVKNNTKLKSKFLTQMGIIKQEQYLNDCIEIIDSDEGTTLIAFHCFLVMYNNSFICRKTSCKENRANG